MRFFDVIKRQFVLMHVTGIPVRADYRWLAVLFLITLVTAGGLESRIDSAAANYLAALVTTILFFGSVLVHELAHAVVARFEGVQVLEIVLHPFGGLARLRHEPETPRAEFRIAAAGPAASFGLAVVFVIFMAVSNAVGAELFRYLLLLLAVFNFLIGIFNLFPGYPLDGGRLLRAYLWRSGKNINEATILTGRCGQVIGGMLIAFGLVIALMRADFFTGFWMILIGLGLYLGYIPFNSIFFERMIASFKVAGNVGFLIYLADSFGYMGSVGVMLSKEIFQIKLSWAQLYPKAVVLFSIIGVAGTLISYYYFSKKFNQLKSS